jgi:glycerol kinase
MTCVLFSFDIRFSIVLKIPKGLGATRSWEEMMGGYVLAIDQGTTSSRAIVFDGSQKVVGSGQKEFTQHFPQSGWVEHDPEEIWSTSVVTVRQAALRRRALPLPTSPPSASPTSARLSSSGTRRPAAPIHNAIVWQDRRTAEYLRRSLKAGWRRKDRFTRPDRPPPRPLFLGDEARLDARPTSKVRGRGAPRRRALLRHRSTRS